MKPAPFAYYAPTEVSEALALLAEHGDAAKILAGGQSLLPLMHMRLARPQVIIDVNRLAGLASISSTAEGGLAVGALTRQRALERDALVQVQQPLLAAAVPLIGHFQIRNRGTVGGSLVHADPAAELPALSVALQAECVVQSATRQRIVKAEDFFLTYLTTVLEPDEMLTEIRLPAWPPAWGWDVQEVCKRAGDFALAGAVAIVQVDDRDVCLTARLVLFGVGETPVRLHRAEEMLRGQRLEAPVLAAAAALVAADLDPETDIHASAAYRKEVGGSIAGRVLSRALSRAKGSRQL